MIFFRTVVFLFFFSVSLFSEPKQNPTAVQPDSKKITTKQAKDTQINSSEEAEKEEETISIEVTHEVVNDFIWRGQSFTGDYLARRNNTPYSSFAQAYTYVPVARVAHTNGFYFELEGNIALKGRSDRDSDQRIQSYPGALPVQLNQWQDRWTNGNFSPDAQGSSVFYDPANNVYTDKCNKALPDNAFLNPCALDPSRVKPYAEKNGMQRSDGLFTTFAYEMEAGRFGSFTVGTWWYYKNDRSNKYTWNEFFIWWELPWLRESLKPTIQSFTQTSYDVGGGYGNQYSSFSLSHTFFSDKPISVEWMSSLGYQWLNNNTSKKSGFNDLTTNWKFIWQDFFVSLNHVYRPDIDLYDNNRTYFQNSQNNFAFSNLSERDGRIADPSKLYGLQNELVYTAIQQSGLAEPLKILAKDSYQNQTIPRHLFWIGIGYTQKF